MKLEDVNVKSLLALFIIIFGMVAIVFIHLEDMVLGAIIGFIGVPLSYFFGASKPHSGTTGQQNIQMLVTDPPPEEEIGGGGTKNDPPPKP